MKKDRDWIPNPYEAAEKIWPNFHDFMGQLIMSFLNLLCWILILLVPIGVTVLLILLCLKVIS